MVWHISISAFGCDIGNIPRALKSLSPCHFSHFFIFLFSSYSYLFPLSPFKSNHTSSPAELSYTIFFLGTFVCVTVTSTSPLTVCIFYLFIIILNVFYTILHFCFCIFLPIWSVSGVSALHSTMKKSWTILHFFIFCFNGARLPCQF